MNMDKKAYVTPEMEDVKLDCEFYLDLINYSSGVNVSDEEDDGEEFIIP